MPGKRSYAVTLALRVYKKGMNVYKLAKRFKVSPSTLYKAIKK